MEQEKDANELVQSEEPMPENRLLNPFQRSNALNEIYAIGPAGELGASYMYSAWRGDRSLNGAAGLYGIVMQNGGRFDPDATEGFEEIDLLLIVHDRLVSIVDRKLDKPGNIRVIGLLESAIEQLIACETDSR